MKYLFPVLIALLLVSCQQETEVFEIPEDLAAKKTMLQEKQKELSTLEKELIALQEAIAKQDVDAIKTGVLITTTEVSRNDFARYITIQGNVAAEDFFDASAEMGGRIIRLHVKEGDIVRSGQLIAEIDPEAVQKQKAELEIALSFATTVFEKQQNLWNQNIGSEVQFLEAKNNKERLEQSIALIDVQLQKTKVYAPGAGNVERVVLQAGELAAPGMPIVQILDVYRLKVSAAVPENYVGAVSKGEVLNVHIPALDLSHQLPVTNIGRTVDPSNRTFEVEVKLPQNQQLKPNLLAEMKIVDFKAKDVVTIPTNLVQQEVSGSKYVLIMEETKDGKHAKKQAVKIGESSEGQIIITEGLKGGEQLIVEGARGLTDGALVKIVE